MLKHLLLSFFLLIELLAKGNVPLVELKNSMDSRSDSIGWINESSIVFDTINNNHFSRTDSANIYGLGYRQKFSNSVLHRSLLVTIKAKVRFASSKSAFGIALSIAKADSTIFWDSKNIDLKTLDTWNEIKIEYRIPASLVVDENTLIIYGWNRDGKDVCDFDDLEIELKEIPQKSFVPFEFKWPDTYLSSRSFDQKVVGSDFKVEVDAKAKSLRIESTDNDSLINFLIIYLEYTKKRTDKHSRKLMLDKFDKISIDDKGDRVKLNLTYPSKIVNVEVEIIIDNLSRSLELKTDVFFKSNVFVQRATLAMEYGVDVSKVFMKNIQIDSLYTLKEYWLEKEGVLFSGKSKDYLTYRNFESSSLQLDHQFGWNLLLNLDYNLDHPMLNFPPMKKSISAYNNRSDKYYIKGQQLNGSIKFKVVEKNKKLMRVLKNPYGYLSSMIWTEHADFSDIRTQRALNFGSENIDNADSAVGGFVGHGIPVTKSVFYDNPTHLKNSEKDARFQAESISIKGSEDFVGLLKQLQQKKFEICLHTPDPFTTSRTIAEEALDYTNKYFSTVNWIDHGYDNGPTSNREDIVCSGLDSTSKFYMADLWKKYGVKYFWNDYYEDSGLYSNTSFYSFFTTPYSGWDDSYPTPEYFKNPVDSNFISWRTTFTLDPSDGSLWNYYFNAQRLNDLVNSRGNCILHCYPARVDSTTGFYSYSGKTIVVNPEFDSILARLKEYKDQGKIWLTTVKEMLEYRLQLENVVIESGHGNSTIVYNNSDKIISGLSLVTDASSVSAGEKNIRIKHVGNEMIAILDLAPREKLILELK